MRYSEDIDLFLSHQHTESCPLLMGSIRANEYKVLLGYHIILGAVFPFNNCVERILTEAEITLGAATAWCYVGSKSIDMLKAYRIDRIKQCKTQISFQM